MEKISTLDKIRNGISRILQNSQLILKYLIKFAAFLILFRTISGLEMFAHVSGRLTSFPVQLVLSAVATLLPNRTGVLIALLLVVYSVFQTSLIGAVMVGLILFLLYVSSANLFPEETYLLVLVPFCIYHRLYLAVPLLCGVYGGVISVVPVVLGVMVYGVMEIVPLFLNLQMGSSINALPQLIQEASVNGLDQITHNDSMIFLIVMSAAVVLITALIRRIPFPYNRYASVGAGSLSGLIFLIVGITKGKIIGSTTVILLLGLAVIAVFVIFELLGVSVNYKEARSLEFEDDEYVYQVRMLPKVNEKKKQEQKKAKKNAPEKEASFEEDPADTAFAEEPMLSVAPVKKAEKAEAREEAAPEASSAANADKGAGAKPAQKTTGAKPSQKKVGGKPAQKRKNPPKERRTTPPDEKLRQAAERKVRESLKETENLPETEEATKRVDLPEIEGATKRVDLPERDPKKLTFGSEAADEESALDLFGGDFGKKH